MLVSHKAPHILATELNCTAVMTATLLKVDWAGTERGQVCTACSPGAKWMLPIYLSR
jgi:hypothetical protein